MAELADFRVALTYDDVDSLALDLYNQIDIILATLNSIKEKFYDMDDYFKGPMADSFKEKYSSFLVKYELIKTNLNTYMDDLMTMKRVYSGIDKHGAAILQDATKQTYAKEETIDKGENLDLEVNYTEFDSKQ